MVCCKVDQKGRDKSRGLSESRCVRKLKGTPCTTTGGRAGQPCTSTNSQGLSRDCPPDPSQSKGTIAVDLSPLATDPPIIKVANTGSGFPKFCNDQPDAQAGCFGSPTCREQFACSRISSLGAGMTHRA